MAAVVNDKQRQELKEAQLRERQAQKASQEAKQRRALRNEKEIEEAEMAHFAAQVLARRKEEVRVWMVLLQQHVDDANNCCSICRRSAD